MPLDVAQFMPKVEHDQNLAQPTSFLRVCMPQENFLWGTSRRRIIFSTMGSSLAPYLEACGIASGHVHIQINVPFYLCSTSAPHLEHKLEQSVQNQALETYGCNPMYTYLGGRATKDKGTCFQITCMGVYCVYYQNC